MCATSWLIGKSNCQKAWNTTKEVASDTWNSTVDFVKNIQWGEVGLGLLQAAGGGFEVLGGWTLATGGTAASGGLLAGITITAGGVLMVDGSSNAMGGLSRAWNGLVGSKEGDTLNFIKRDVFMKLSSTNGEEYYNYYQLGLGVLSLGLSAQSVASGSYNVVKSANGAYQLSQPGVTVGYTVVEGNISKMTINYLTNSGSVYKSVDINTGLIISGTLDITSTSTNMFITSKSFK